MQRPVIKEATRKRCRIVELTPTVLEKLVPISLELFHFLYHSKVISFSLYARIGQELVEYVPKGPAHPEYLDELSALYQKSRRECEVCILRGERAAFDALINAVRQEKISTLSRKLPDLDKKTLDLFAALSGASQLVVAGGIDPSVIASVKASAAYLVANAIDSDVTVSTLSRMIICDPTLYDHSATVAMISAVIATRLLPRKVTTREAEVIAQAALFHDVGKTCVPLEILNKPGKLTPVEFDVMKTHTTEGFEEVQKLIENGASLNDFVARVALEHHEKWDGRGYPHGRKGAFEDDPANGIHLYSRIVTIADIYSALLMKRVYKPAFEPQDAIKVMAEEAHGFDPGVFVPFLKSVVRSLNTEQDRHRHGGRILAFDERGNLTEIAKKPKSA